MSISYQEYIKSQSNYSIQQFDNITFDILVDLFGDELRYNQLVKYKDLDNIELIVATKLFDNNICVLTVWINKEYIQDIEFKNYGSILVYKLEQLFIE